MCLAPPISSGGCELNPEFRFLQNEDPTLNFSQIRCQTATEKVDHSMSHPSLIRAKGAGDLVTSVNCDVALTQILEGSGLRMGDVVEFRGSI